MSEEKIIASTGDLPITIHSLVTDLAALGVKPGMTLLVHSSLSKLGWVSGGAAAVVLALEEALGPDGTLVMPTHSGDLSDPALWQNPPVPPAWIEPIRQTMPAFSPDLTPTRGMGVIAETFRRQDGVIRSTHPHVSFAARGPYADQITRNHQLDFSLGEGSPLARLYDLDAWVLLLGVDHSNNTSLHLAEYRADYPGKRIIRQGAPVLVDGARCWVALDDINYNESDFDSVGRAFARQTALELKGKVGLAQSRLFSQRAVVDFAGQWMMKNRQGA